MSKLLLIFALAVLSFARTRPIVKDTDATSIYFDNQKIVSDNVTIDYELIDDDSGFMEKIKIADITPISNVPATNGSYVPVVQSKFNNLKTSQPWYVVPEGGDAGVPCDVVDGIHKDGTYGLYGYAAYVIQDADIAPSISALIKQGPSHVNYIHVPDTEHSEYYDNRTNAKTCGDPYVIDDLSFALNTYGLYDAACVPNTAIPTAIPSTCKSSLSGFREGYFFNLTTAALKDLLVRFGPIIYYTSSADRWSVDTYGLLLGWEGTKWIKVVRDATTNGYTLAQEDKSAIETSGTFDGIVILNTDAILCSDIKAETPVSICPCPDSKTDKEAFEADPRHELGPKCASGSMRAAWAVVVAALAIPVLSLFL